MSLWIDAFCFYQLGIIYNVIEVAFRPGEHRFNLKCFCSNFVLLSQVMVDRREADLQTKLNEATNVDREKKEFLKNFFEDEEPYKANKSPKAQENK